MQAYPDIRLETDRLIVRAWTSDDAEDAFVIYGDPDVAEFLTGVVEESVDTQRALLKKIVASNTLIGRGLGSFATQDRATGRVIGCAMLKPIPRTEDRPAWAAFRDALGTGGDPPSVPPFHEIEVGWHLAKSAWGKGLATEAARRMLDYGFGELGLDEVCAVVYKDNRRSLKVAEGLGMKCMGPTDRFYGVTLEHYRIRADEWRAP